MSTTGYGLEEQINDLNAELRDERRRADSLMETLDASQKERDELCTQIAEYKTDREYIHGWNAGFEEAQAQINELQKFVKAQDELIRQLTASLFAHGTATWETKDVNPSILNAFNAQIAAKDALLDEWKAKAIENAVIAERALKQIAAKDAEIEQIINECIAFPIKDGLAFRVESIALNALASTGDK